MENESRLLSIRHENPVTSTAWDRLLSAQSGVSIFHSAAWARVLAQTYDCNPVYLTATQGDKVVSVLPLMEVESCLKGRRGVSLPFTDECEILSESAHSATVLVEEALQLASKRGWKYVQFRGHVEKFRNAKPSLSFFGHKLALTRDCDSLLRNFEGSVRRAIRKAENSGLRIEISTSLAATKAYYQLHCKTRQEHGIPPQPFRFFRNIQEHILAQGLGVVVTAKFEEQAIASAVYFYRGPEAVYKFGASDRGFQELRANNLVMWEAIKFLAGSGVTILRFGRTSAGNEGLRRYKSAWAVVEYPIDYFKFDVRRNGLVPERDSESGWHTKVFRALPLPVARWVGAALYKHAA